MIQLLHGKGCGGCWEYMDKFFKMKFFICIIIAIIVMTVMAFGYLFTNPFYSKLIIKLIDNQSYEDLEKACRLPFANINASPAVSPTLRKVVELPEKLVPLNYACSKNDLKAVEILLKNKADPNADGNLQTSKPFPLEIAASHGNLDMIKLLIEYGADVEEQAIKAIEAQLKYGVRTGTVDIESFKSTVSLFVQHGFVANKTNLNGESIFLSSAIYSNIEVSKFLVSEIGLDTQAQNNNGQTALHLVCISGWISEPSVEYIEFLIDSGIDPRIKDKYGKTAYDYAIERGNYSIAELLR